LGSADLYFLVSRADASRNCVVHISIAHRLYRLRGACLHAFAQNYKLTTFVYSDVESVIGEQMQRYDLLAIGNLTLDIVYEVDRIPELDETGLVLHQNTYFGGRAGNIAIMGARLGLDVAIASIVGGDFVESGYKDHLLRHRVNIGKVKILEKKECAKIHVYRQRDGKHIYFFQPNVQRSNHKLNLNEEDLTGFKVIYLTSFNSEQTATELMGKIKPPSDVFFGLGEEIYRKSRNFLESVLEISNYIGANEREFETFLKKMSLSSVAEIFDIGTRLRFVCISLGEKGSVIYTPDKKYVIPAVPSAKLVSTLGAGDAYVTGLVYGIVNQWNIENCGRLGSVLSSFILEAEGAQNTSPNWGSLKKRYNQFFGKLP